METLLRVEYRPHTISDLARILDCSLDVFEKSIAPFLDLIGPIKDFMCSIRQVRTIFNVLGRFYILVPPKG